MKSRLKKSAALIFHIRCLLRKHFFYFIKKAFLAFTWLWFKIRTFIHLIQHFFFFVCDILWRPNIYMNQLITSAIAIYLRKAFAFKPEDLTALCARRYFNFSPSINCWYFSI